MLIVAGASAIVAVLVAAAIAGAFDLTTPGPTKAQEVEGAVESSTALSNPAGTVSYVDPASDSGTAADISKVKTDVVADLQADRAITGPTTVPADLQAQLSGIYASAVLGDTVVETTRAMVAAQGDPTYRPYDRNTFTVVQWQGIQVSGTTATAVFSGYDSYSSPGDSTFEADTTRQWQVKLALEAGRWKLVSQNSVDPDDVATPGGVDQLP